MSKQPRVWAPLALGVAFALLFGSLGVWQLERLAERRDDNRERERAMRAPILDLGSGAEKLPPSDSVLWRRVRVDGKWDLEREIVVRGRSWLGSPGVAILTPVRRTGGEALLVLRGWLPAADGLSADLSRARVALGGGREVAALEGLAIPGEGASAVPPRLMRYQEGEHLVLGSIDAAAAGAALPYPVAPFVVQVLPETRSRTRVAVWDSAHGPPTPFPVPELTDGPHLFYAFQWFGFAAIALAGGLLLPRAARQGRRAPELPSAEPSAGPRTHPAGEESR